MVKGWTIERERAEAQAAKIKGPRLREASAEQLIMALVAHATKEHKPMTVEIVQAGNRISLKVEPLSSSIQPGDTIYLKTRV